MTDNLPVLNERQKSFLHYLKNDAKGDLKKAKELAGYSENTKVSDIIKQKDLKEAVIEAAKEVLAEHSIKAVYGLVDVLDSPASLGAANKLKAASEILNRLGVDSEDHGEEKIPKGAIVILPPKE